MPNEKKEAPESKEIEASSIQTEKKLADGGQQKPEASASEGSGQKTA